MPPSDVDITRTAHLRNRQHGDDATATVRQKVDEMRSKGDAEGADTWLRIIVAIGTLGIAADGCVSQRAVPLDQSKRWRKRKITRTGVCSKRPSAFIST
jgi:hypothetical protein